MRARLSRLKADAVYIAREFAAIFVSCWFIPALLLAVIGCLVFMGLGIFVDPARIALRVFIAASAFLILRQGAKRRARER